MEGEDQVPSPPGALSAKAGTRKATVGPASAGGRLVFLPVSEKRLKTCSFYAEF